MHSNGSVDADVHSFKIGIYEYNTLNKAVILGFGDLVSSDKLYLNGSGKRSQNLTYPFSASTSCDIRFQSSNGGRFIGIKPTSGSPSSQYYYLLYSGMSSSDYAYTDELYMYPELYIGKELFTYTKKS